MATTLCARTAMYVLAGSILTACSDETPTVPVALAASPTELTLTVEEPEAVFSLATTPSGGRLDWHVTASPDWVEVTPSSGTIDGQVVTVTVFAPGLDSLPPGSLTGRIALISDGGAAEVTLTTTIAARPAMSLSVTEVEFPEQQDTAWFYLYSGGNAPLTWSIAEPGPYLDVAPRDGTLAAGDSARINVGARREGLPVGTAELALTIESNADPTLLSLPIRIDVPAVPRIEVSRALLRFVGTAAVDSFSIINPGTGVLTWSAQPDDAWIELSPTSGEVAPGGVTAVTVSLNAEAIPGDHAEASITVASNARDDAIPLAVVASQSSGWAPGLEVLEHRVVDAEYSRASDLLVTVSVDPSRLHVIDPQLGTVHDVELSFPPTAISIGPDGRFAAVGHDRHVSYVDLLARSVVRTYAVSTDALDIVLAGNGWVYVFPRHDQWVPIHCIELETGRETLSGDSDIYAGTVARLHPSGDFIYGANRDLSPSNFEKYSIRDGTARYLYGSPYHGDHDFSGDIWTSDDGARLFARSGNVFRASTAPQEDMLYAGSLVGVSFAQWVEHSAAANRIYVLDSPDWGETPATELRVYDPATLTFLGTVPLPPFVGSETAAEHPAHGRFVFVDESGDRVYTLVQTDPVSGLAQDWALVVFERAEMP